MDKVLNRLTSPHGLRLMSYDADKHAEDAEKLAEKHRSGINKAGIALTFIIAGMIGYAATDKNHEVSERIVEAVIKSVLALPAGWFAASAAILVVLFITSLPRR